MTSWGNTASRNGRGNGRNTSDDMLDNQNQLMTENLAGKVSRLKNIAFDMETEAKDSNKFIGGLDEDFDSSAGLLTGSMNRINHMIGSGKNNRRLMCYIILGLVLLFILLFYFISHFRS